MAEQWEARTPEANIGLVVRISHDDQGRRVTTFIATCQSAVQDNPATARQIAREHNAHEPLVAACEAALEESCDDCIEHGIAPMDCINSDCRSRPTAFALTAALKLAREEGD